MDGICGLSVNKSAMLPRCAQLKFKYVFIFGLITILTVFFILVRERTASTLLSDERKAVLLPSVQNLNNFQIVDNDYSVKLPVQLTDTGEFRRVVDKESENDNAVKDKRVYKDDGGSVNVYVVEEHHEVLPYWFEAANNGIISKDKNTLIHFDGHSDLAPPTYMTGYPFFKWPNASQLKYLLQSNDAFIQAGTMMGLIDRLIWVWPTWDRESHAEEYIKIPIKLGWFKEPNGTGSIDFCMCASLNQTYLCRSTTDFGLGDDENGYEMPITACKIQKILIFEEVSESYALTYFRRKYTLRAGHHVILDIDEDYYGCTYAVMPLLNANISLGRVKQINKRTAAFFCPKTSQQDHEIDRILYSVVELIHQQKRCLLPNKKLVRTDSCGNLTDTFIRKYFVNEIVRKNQTSVINLCPLKLTSLSTLINSILQHFKKLNEKQLLALQEVGFCSSTSPKTYYMYYGDGYTLCMGANTPAASAVLIHHPTSQENRERSKLLDEIIKSIPNLSPKVVTVARSVRDGYTPREYFEVVENDVLSILKSRFKDDLKLSYDKDLLGGEYGWPARRRKLASTINIPMT